MVDTAHTSQASQKALRWSSISFFSVVAIGQWLFLAYIITFYGGNLIAGTPENWNANFSGAFTPKAPVNNTLAALHIFLSIVIHGLGPLQFIPAIRRRAPKLHRWIGRSFFVALLVTVPAGAYLLIARDIGELTLKLGFGLQMVLILIFGLLAIREAMARRFVTHMRWAMRLFLAASAVWFFRVLIMVWFVTTGGIGIDTDTGKGWFLDIMAIGQFLPLIFLELYYLSQRSSRIAQYTMSGTLFVATLLLAIGVTLAFVFMWLPYMS